MITLNEKERKKVKEMVDDFFVDVADEFDLVTGDITPGQSLKVEEFEKLIEEYIAQNR